MKPRRMLWVGLILAGLVSPAAAENVLIFGGSGHTGSRIAKQLDAEGHEVTAFVRPTSKRARLDGTNVRFAVGDVFKEDTVAKAFAQAKPDVVIAVLQGRAGQESVHGKPEIRLNEVATNTGVEHFIYLSSVGAGDASPSHGARSTAHRL